MEEVYVNDVYDSPGHPVRDNLCHYRLHGGLCRLHHGLKQLPGWRLTQDAQGYFTWRAPAGLTYREKPYQYAV